MKRKYLMIIVILTIIILLTLIYLFIPKCGPESAGGGRNVKYCDKFCKLVADCEFKCGCGVINKIEKCNTGKMMIECEYPPLEYIKCQENKCVIDLGK